MLAALKASADPGHMAEEEGDVAGAFAKAAKVVAASSPVAEMVEIHEMKMDDGVMKMRAVDALALPAGQPVALKPGSYHVMLMGLKAPIKAGDTVPLTLTVEGEDKQRTTVEIKAEARGR